MKYKLLAVCMTLGVGIAAADPGFMLTVKPGNLVEGFDLGVKAGRFVPMFGLDVGSAGMSSHYTVEYNDSLVYEFDEEVGLTVFAPHIGFKYLLGRKDLRPYVGMSFLYTFGSASVVFDGVEDEDLSDRIGDVLSGNWGLGVNFGGEYFFSKNFSLGGSVGFKYFRGATSSEFESVPGYIELTESTLGLGLSMANWSLNFYF
ncbi:hypothetical protein IBX73_07215 [candidate division WOR-3 bacterium]|nr:hypothetical protein [candidate division WOR-3 bacterium]